MNGVSIIIPCYNEEGNLKIGVLDEVAAFLDTWDVESEVCIVDDASTDASLALVRAFADRHPRFRVRSIPHGGKPAAVRAGIEDATMDVILFTDMDQSTPLGEAPKLIEKIAAGYDVAIGSRGGERAGFSAFRKLASATFRSMRRAALLGDINDTQCGFKAMRRELALELFPRLSVFSTGDADGWTVSAFDVELLFMAQKRGAKIAEVPVEWEDRDASTTKFESGALTRFVKESLDMATQVASVKINDIKGTYD